MRVTSRVTSVSWIPSESVQGLLKLSFTSTLAHYDDPPTDRLDGPDALTELQQRGAFRWANVLSGWAEFDGETPVGWGYGQDAGIVPGSTTVRVGPLGATFAMYTLPSIRPEAEVRDGEVVLTQTVGGRAGVPLPRRVAGAPHVQWNAPIVWTTLRLSLRSDGTATGEMTGASTFPRHWVYGEDGALIGKSVRADPDTWLANAFGAHTPWGDENSPVMVAEAESAIERQLSTTIMRGGRRPEVRNHPVGHVLTQQGEPGADLFLVLDGALEVTVDGDEVGQVGPGAVIGERAVLEGGLRTSTLTALTPVRVAVARAEDVDTEALRAVAERHRREDALRDGTS